MSKVKKEIVQAAALKLMTSITATMPTPAHKFLLGSAQALATMNNGEKLMRLLGATTDEEGYMDLDILKAAVCGGFDAAGGKISIDLFKNNGGLMSMFVKPLTLTITKDDIMNLMAEIEEEAIQDVRISNENAKTAEKPVQPVP